MLILLCTRAVVYAQRTSNERDDGGEQTVIDDCVTVHMILMQNLHIESERYSTWYCTLPFQFLDSVDRSVVIANKTNKISNSWHDAADANKE